MKKTYLIYGGFAILVGMGLYVIFKNDNPPTDTTETDTTTDATQGKMDENLSKAQSVGGKNPLMNKQVYTKVNDVKLRTSNYVNDGIINNVWGTIPYKDTLLGVVKNQYEDHGKMINKATKKPYIWYGVELNENAWNIGNDSKNFLTKDRVGYKYAKHIYFVREDVIRL